MAARGVDLGRGIEHAGRELGQPPQRAARWQVSPQLAVGGTPPAGPPPPRAEQRERMTEHRADAGELVQGRPRPLGQQEEHGAQRGQHQVAGQRGQGGPQRQVAEQGEQRVVPVHPARPGRGRGGPAVPRGGFQVVDDRVGDDPHPVPGRVHPPAEVHVVPEQRHGLVEATELIPHVPADQQAGAVHRQHVTVAVVLALVHLARLDVGDPAARGVDGHAGLEQHPAVRPVHHLGPEHGRATRLGRAAQQLLQRVGLRLAVVVQQPDPLGALAGRQAGRAGHVGVGRPVPQRLRHRRAVPGPPVHAEHDRAAEQFGEHGAAAIPAPGVHRDYPLYRPGLAEQRLGDARQPRGTIMGDDHRGNDVLAVRVR